MPINNKQICFEAFEGRQIACNPYYIYLYLVKEYPNLDYIWIYNKYHHDGNIKYVKRGTLKYIYILMTSKVYISNDDMPVYIPFRKAQMMINTWHGGGAYKRIGTALHQNTSTQLHFKMYNRSVSWFISNNSVFTDIISKSFLVDKYKFLPLGQPRNDLLFNTDEVARLNKKIRKQYSIAEEDFIVLYAPTFRSFDNTVFESELQLQLVANAVKKRFNKNCVLLVRGHHGMSSIRLEQSKLNVHNVSDYEYMQELLCAADMLISDYSSCIWDYSFLYRPCFLFVQDLSDYEGRQNFYTPIESWGFPIAKNSDELAKAIILFDYNEFVYRMQCHHAELGSYEEGTATVGICNLIMSHIDRQ